MPKEIIAAMLAGLVTNYVVQIVHSVKILPIVAIIALVSFFISTRFSKRIPAVLITVIAAFIALFLTGDLHISANNLTFTIPSIQLPAFSWNGSITIALPLALLILSNDIAAGIGALESSSYQPPIRKVVSWRGIFSVFPAFLAARVLILAA